MNTKKTVLASLTLAAMVSTPVLANDWKGHANDAWLDGKVEAALLVNNQVNNFDIDTDVKNGVVTLSGDVDSQAKKDLAEHLASNVTGVAAVQNNISVAAGDSAVASAKHQLKQKVQDWKGTANDAWIDGRVETSLMFNTELNSFKIDTDVKNGVVVLSGEVGNETEKDLAGRLAANVQGTKAVTNLLSVKEGHKGGDNPGRQLARKMNDISVTTGLNIEFAAHQELEATKIDVDTKNGVVVLTGTVKSEAAKDLAVEMAKDYDHVVSVEDNLKVVK